MITITDTRMLGLWRTRAGLEPSLSDASIERFDACEVDTELRLRMRAWYLDLLNNGPLDMVPVTDIADRVDVVATPTDGVWTVTLPPDTTRLVDIAVEGTGPLTVINPDDPAAQKIIPAMDNRFIRLGNTPKAVHRPGSRRITIYAPARSVLTALHTVQVPDDTTYILDERALSQIPNF